MNGVFVCYKEYDFVDKEGNMVQGANCNVYLPDNQECVKASVKDHFEQYKAMKFGQQVNLDVQVLGRYAKYILN